jgi:hypothetical protein
MVGHHDRGMHQDLHAVIVEAVTQNIAAHFFR